MAPPDRAQARPSQGRRAPRAAGRPARPPPARPDPSPSPHGPFPPPRAPPVPMPRAEAAQAYQNRSDPVGGRCGRGCYTPGCSSRSPSPPRFAVHSPTVSLPRLAPEVTLGPAGGGPLRPKPATTGYVVGFPTRRRKASSSRGPRGARPLPPFTPRLVELLRWAEATTSSRRANCFGPPCRQASTPARATGTRPAAGWSSRPPLRRPRPPWRPSPAPGPSERCSTTSSPEAASRSTSSRPPSPTDGPRCSALAPRSSSTSRPRPPWPVAAFCPVARPRRRSPPPRARRSRCWRRRSGRLSALPAPRRHRLRQDRGLPAAHRPGPGPRARRLGAGPGDRPHPAAFRPVPGPLRRRGGPASLRPLRRRAPRRVAAPAPRTRPHLRRRAKRHLRPRCRTWRAGGGRGARRQLKQEDGPPTTPATAVVRAKYEDAVWCWARPPPPWRRSTTPTAAATRPSPCLPGWTTGPCRWWSSWTSHGWDRDPAELPGMLSPRLVEAIEQTLSAGQQTILFLNRRGFETLVLCEACGAEARCTECSVSLTHHARRGVLLCHYCGHSEPVGGRCPACGGLRMGVGVGTEQVEAAVRSLFPAPGWPGSIATWSPPPTTPRRSWPASPTESWTCWWAPRW